MVAIREKSKRLILNGSMLYPQTFGNSVEMRFERILSKSKLMPSFMKYLGMQLSETYKLPMYMQVI